MGMVGWTALFIFFINKQHADRGSSFGMIAFVEARPLGKDKRSLICGLSGFGSFATFTRRDLSRGNKSLTFKYLHPTAAVTIHPKFAQKPFASAENIFLKSSV